MYTLNYELLLKTFSIIDEVHNPPPAYEEATVRNDTLPIDGSNSQKKKCCDAKDQLEEIATQKQSLKLELDKLTRKYGERVSEYCS